MACGGCGGLVAWGDLCLEVRAESNSSHFVGVSARLVLRIGRLPFHCGVLLVHIGIGIFHDG